MALVDWKTRYRMREREIDKLQRAILPYWLTRLIRWSPKLETHPDDQATRIVNIGQLYPGE